MIDKLDEKYTFVDEDTEELRQKTNEIIDVVNALIDGDFPDSIYTIEFLRKLLENIRTAQSRTKGDNSGDGT